MLGTHLRTEERKSWPNNGVFEAILAYDGNYNVPAVCFEISPTKGLHGLSYDSEKNTKTPVPAYYKAAFDYLQGKISSFIQKQAKGITKVPNSNSPIPPDSIAKLHDGTWIPTGGYNANVTYDENKRSWKASWGMGTYLHEHGNDLFQQLSVKLEEEWLPTAREMIYKKMQGYASSPKNINTDAKSFTDAILGESPTVSGIRRTLKQIAPELADDHATDIANYMLGLMQDHSRRATRVNPN